MLDLVNITYPPQTTSCGGIYGACTNHAHACHTVGIVACTATSVAFIAASGSGAVLFQSFCLAANWDYYKSGLDVCGASYDGCMGN